MALAMGVPSATSWAFFCFDFLARILGKPANTKVGITIDTDWFWGLVEECVRGYIKTH